MIECLPARERPPPQAKAQPERLGFFIWARRYNAPMRTLLFVCLAISLHAQSTAPPLTPRVLTEGQEKKGTDKKTKSTENEDVDRSFPTVQNEPRAAPETQGLDSKNIKEYKAPTNKSLNIPNLLLVFFSGALAVVAYLQWTSMERQIAIMGRQTEIIDGSLRVAQDSLASLREYVGLTGEIAKAGKESADGVRASNELTRYSNDLTRQSIALNHRPKLTISNVLINGDMGGLRERSTADGKLSIVNKGGLAAHIIEIFATVRIYAKLPMKTFQDIGVTGDQTRKILGPGQRMAFPFKKEDGALVGGEIPALHRGGTNDPRRLHVLGFIRYVDDLTPPTTRQTCFCRVLNPDTGRFEAVKDDDYESVD